MKAETLKKSILQYAMQGKLVEQNPDDEPANELLKRIKAEKEQLIKDGKIKKEKKLPPITDEEIPYELPKGWEWVRLDNLSQNIHYGYNGSANFNLKEPKLVRITDIQNNSINWNNVPACEIKEHEIQNYKLQRKDILIARTGGTMGKTYLVEEVPSVSIFASYLIRCIPLSINAKYLKIFMESPLYWQQLYNKASGTGQPNVNGTSLKSLIVPLPPLAEQQRIVEKLEQILSLIEEYGKNEEKLSELNKTLPDKIKQSILQHAVQGKLVPQNPTDEPASELLKRIKSEKEQLIKDGKIKKEKPLPSITEDEIPYELPKGWEWVRLDNLSQNIHYGYNGSANFNLKEPKLVRITDIQNNSINWNNVPACEIKEHEIQNYKLQRKDILIARTGGTMGKTYLVEEVPSVSIFASYLIRCIPLSINAKYLKIFMESPLYWQQLYNKASGTGQPNVNGTSLKSLIVPLPPLAEQQRIVDKVEELMSIANKLEHKEV